MPSGIMYVSCPGVLVSSREAYRIGFQFKMYKSTWKWILIYPSVILDVDYPLLINIMCDMLHTIYCIASGTHTCYTHWCCLYTLTNYIGICNWAPSSLVFLSKTYNKEKLFL